MAHDNTSLRFVVALAIVATASAACTKTDTPSTPKVEAAAAAPPAKPAGITTPVDLKTFGPLNGAIVAQVQDGVQITTHPGSGGFSAQIPIPDAARKAGPGRVLVKVLVSKGGAILDTTKAGDGNAALSERATVLASEPEKTVALAMTDLSAPAVVLVANGSDKGPSTLTIRSIDVVQP